MQLQPSAAPEVHFAVRPRSAAGPDEGRAEHARKRQKEVERAMNTSVLIENTVAGCIFLYLPTDLRAHVVVSGMPSTCKGYSGTKFKFSTAKP
eukprot:SAG11_NODE_23273_length_391_cov_8.726027_1_plen_92_part_10